MQAEALPTDQQSGYLVVSLSASGKRWEARADEPRLTAALAQRFDLPEPVARALAARGIALEGAEAFLDPKLSRDLPDPMHLLDMDKAARRIAGVDSITMGSAALARAREAVVDTLGVTLRNPAATDSVALSAKVTARVEPMP